MPIRVLVRSRSDRDHLLMYYVDPLTGREVHKTAGTSDRREAERAAGQWERELAEYRGPANDGWKFFRDRFRDEHLATLAPRTQAGFGTALNHYQRLMNPHDLGSVTAAAVSTYQAKLLGEGRPLSSIANYLTHLRSAINWAEHVGLVAKAPKIRLPKQNQRSFMKGRPLTEAEFRQMVKVAPAPLRRMLELLWHSGLRLGEAMLLSWDSPPLKLEVDAKPYPVILYYAEGHKARRDEVVPLTREFHAWLLRTPLAQRKGVVAPVPWRTLKRLSKAITAAGEAAGIVVNTAEKFASAHDLRRSFGSRLAQKVMPATLQKLMRHADISTTLRYYIAITASDAGRELWGDPVPTNVPKTQSKRARAG